jgi:hypothetical protein
MSAFASLSIDFQHIAGSENAGRECECSNEETL